MASLLVIVGMGEGNRLAITSLRDATRTLSFSTRRCANANARRFAASGFAIAMIARNPIHEQLGLRYSERGRRQIQS